jgi:hypothetical protein
VPISASPMSPGRITRNISRHGLPSSRPTRRRSSPPHRKRQKPQRFSPDSRAHERPLPSRVSQFSSMPAVPQRTDHTNAFARPRPEVASRSAAPCFSDHFVTRRPQGFRSSLCPFAKTDARPATSRLCPLLPTRRSPSKPNGFPPTGCPPLRHGAKALLTAHSIRIGDRTGIEVASPATSKLERTSDD